MSISGYTDSSRPHHYYDDEYPGVCFLREPLEYVVSSKQVTISPPDLGVTLNIPSDAVPRGERVTVTIRPCLFGPFQYPEGYEPLSAVYHISINTALKKKGQLTLEHFGHLQTKQQADSMTFFTANSPPVVVDGKEVYQFDVVKGGEFEMGKYCGTIFLEHLCFVAEGMKTEDEVATDEAEQSYRNSESEHANIMRHCLVFFMLFMKEDVILCCIVVLVR